MHKVLINKPKNLIRAKFMEFTKYSARVFDKIVLLFLALMFIVEDCCGKQFQLIEYQGYIQIF